MSFSKGLLELGDINGCAGVALVDPATLSLRLPGVYRCFFIIRECGGSAAQNTADDDNMASTIIAIFLPRFM